LPARTYAARFSSCCDTRVISSRQLTHLTATCRRLITRVLPLAHQRLSSGPHRFSAPRARPQSRAPCHQRLSSGRHRFSGCVSFHREVDVPVEAALRKRGCVLIKNLVGIEHVGAARFFLGAAPLRLPRGESAPTRALAVRWF
jgi:hypothetical protein